MKQVLLGDTINLLGIRNKVILAHSNANRTGMNIYMKAIDTVEETRLDKRSDKTSIYFYGDIDINNPDDVKIIKQYNFFETNGLGMVYNNFDYERGQFGLVDSVMMGKVEKIVKWGGCLDPVTWFKYNHCLLGKPKKVMVYNDHYADIFRRR